MTYNYKNFYKREEWPKGEWDNEPDVGGWVDENTGLQCAFVRTNSGALCGYVGVPEGHKFYGVSYASIEIEEEGPDVHGGLTYSGKEGMSFLRKYVPTRPDPWWLGFRCSHSGDVMPGMTGIPSVFGNPSYKNLEYVKSEVASLAQQLAAPAACEEPALITKKNMFCKEPVK